MHGVSSESTVESASPRRCLEAASTTTAPASTATSLTRFRRRARRAARAATSASRSSPSGRHGSIGIAAAVTSRTRFAQPAIDPAKAVTRTSSRRMWSRRSPTASPATTRIRGASHSSPSSARAATKRRRSERAFHAPKTVCTDCHKPHGFDLSRCRGPRLLRGLPPDAGSARPSGLRTIRAASLATGERPTRSKDPVACVSCHEDISTASPEGHRECASCHEPHGGTVAAATSLHELPRDRASFPVSIESPTTPGERSLRLRVLPQRAQLERPSGPRVLHGMPHRHRRPPTRRQALHRLPHLHQREVKEPLMKS